MGSPAYAIVQDGAIWIADHRDPQVDRLDPTSGRIVASVEMTSGGPFDHNAMLVPGVGGPWAWPFVIDNGRSVITHVNASTNTASTSAAIQIAVNTIGISGADAVADTTGGLWAVGEGLVAADLREIDRGDGHVIVATRIAGTASNHLLVFASGSLWLGNSGENVLYRIDPRSGRLVSATTLPAWPVDVAMGPNVLYVAGADNSVARVDAATGCVTAQTFVGGSTDSADDEDWVRVAADGKAVYVAYDRGALAVLDPSSLSVRYAERVDPGEDYQGGLAVGGGSVWYTTFVHDTVIRVRP